MGNLRLRVTPLDPATDMAPDDVARDEDGSFRVRLDPIYTVLGVQRLVDRGIEERTEVAFRRDCQRKFRLRAWECRSIAVLDVDVAGDEPPSGGG